jgi:hypothetical protein
VREALLDADVHCLVAESGSGLVGQRLFVAAGHARARRFYEREGWLPAGEPFADPTWGLTFVEYRYGLRDRR